MKKRITFFKHTVFKNAFFLLLVEFCNYLAPVIILPYLARVLSVQNVGFVSTIFSFNAICLIIIDYGFNLSSISYISNNRGKKEEINQYIGGVYIVKLMIIGLIVLPSFLLLCQYDNSKFNYSIYIFCFLSVIFQSLIPTWLFLGIEKMKNISFFAFFSKLIYIILVLLFVKDNTCINFLFMSLAISNLIGLIISMYLMSKEGFIISYPSLSTITYAFKESTPFFLSRISVASYTAASGFIVGSFSNLYQAALYGVSEKIYIALTGILSPITAALYPYIANNKKSVLYKKIVIKGLFVLIPATIITFFISDELIMLFFGDGYTEAVSVLNIFLITVSINFISVNYGYPAFASIDKLGVPNLSVIVGGAVQVMILLTFILFKNITAVNVACAVLIAESIVMLIRVVSFYYYSRREAT